MNPERAVTINGRSYPLIFNTNATFQLGLYLRQNTLGTIGDFIARLVSGRAELVDIQIFFWACLEGARRKTHWRPQPFTLDEAGELIDASGGLAEIAQQIIASIEAASPKATGTGDGKPKNGTTASGTGTRSSRKPRKSASAQTISGT